MEEWMLFVYKQNQRMKGSELLPEVRKKIGQYSYTPKDVIGKGYSSVVYRGANDSTGQSIAVKLIDMKNIKGEVHKTLLTNEIDILRMLNDLQNVIRLHEIIPLKTHTCIITELCDGGDLSKLIKQRRTIPEKEALDILTQIINGYKEIYRYGIVHRDLKPANIFFTNVTAKIADFGFAIRGSDLKKNSNYNVGSPVYMPLEALNDNLYSNKSDVWAIGVIFYQMLTGHTPWRAKTETDLKRQIKAISIKSILPIGISKLSTEFLMRSLQLNPTLRMSPEEMVLFFTDGHETQQVESSNNIRSNRTNYLFRTRAVSHDKQERPQPLPIAKTTVTAPKTIRKFSKAGELNNPLERISQFAGTQKVEPQQNQGIVLDRIGEHKLGNLARTVAGMGEWMPDHKKISNQLLSQIHLCRFFYKLIQRMDFIGEGFSRLKGLMGSLIGGKLGQLKQLRVINPRYASIYRRSKEFQQIQEVIDQYLAKYHRIISGDTAVAYETAISEIDSELTTQILKLHEEIVTGMTMNREEKIVLLDYLITMKQLLVINSNKDIEYFHQKSKIEAIVEGKPARNITEQHLEAILHKLRVFKMIV